MYPVAVRKNIQNNQGCQHNTKACMVMHVLLPAEACQSNYSILKGARQVVQLASSILCNSDLEEQYSNTVQFQ